MWMKGFVLVLEQPCQFIGDVTIFLTLFFRLVDMEFKVMRGSIVIGFSGLISYSACFNDCFFSKVKIKDSQMEKKFLFLKRLSFLKRLPFSGEKKQ